MRIKAPKLETLIKHKSKWLEGTGPSADIAVSSRIRIARNLDGFPFTLKATEAALTETMKQVELAAKKSPTLKRAIFLKLNELSELDKEFLHERHLISTNFLKSKSERACIINEKEEISIMVNEEDILRIQVMQSGLQIKSAYKLADKIDDELEATLNYAFSHTLGYLTCCPTNTGTGLRASLHGLD